MTTEEFYTLCERCKGRYLRIDHNSDKTLLIYSPVVEPASFGHLILRSSDAYEIQRYTEYNAGKYTRYKIRVERTHDFFFRLDFNNGVKIYKSPYNVRTAKRLVKAMLFSYDQY